MDASPEMHGRYDELCQRARTGDLSEIVKEYEALLGEARAAGDPILQSRCLSDLAALVAEHDADVAHSLLQSAASFETGDPAVLENLARLERRRGQPDRAIPWAIRAARAALSLGDLMGAAQQLDLFCPAGDGPGEATEVRSQLLAALEQRLPAAPPSPGNRAVLLAGDLTRDAEVLQRRVERCRESGELPVVVLLQPLGGVVPAGARCLPLDPSDARELLDLLEAAFEGEAFLRAELCASTDRLFWTAVAMTARAPLAAGERSPETATEWVVEPAPPELSVVIPCRDRAGALGRLLRALSRQTLPRQRFEVIVVDDGSEPPLADQLEPAEKEGVQILRQTNQGPAAARNTALGHCRSDLVLFLNGDALPGEEALAWHVREQERAGRPVAILGRFDPLPGERRFLVEMADRAGLLFPYAGLTPRSDLPSHYFWTCNLSVPIDAVRAAGGFDATCRPMCEDIELGARLARRGIPVQFVPEIECYHDHPMTVADLVERCRWMGHDWVRVARKHGDHQPLLFPEPVTPDEKLAGDLLREVLEEEDKIQRFRATLQHTEREVDAILEKQGARRGEVMEPIAADAMLLLRCVFWHEVKRGLLGGILGFTPGELRALERSGDRLAAVILGDRDHSMDLVRRVLRTLPQDAELIVALAGEDRDRLPEDPRLRVARTSGHDGVGARRELLRASAAEVWVFLDGTRVPGASEWQELRRAICAVPVVGAVGLGGPSGAEVAVVSLTESPPASVLATRRDVIEGDAPGEGSFLERVRRGGRRLAEVRPSGRNTEEACRADAELALSS